MRTVRVARRRLRLSVIFTEMTDESSYLFIINPAAGRRSAGGLTDAISSFSGSRNISFDIRLTRAAGDSRRIASDGVKEGFSRIVSVGGDGTSSDIANAVAGTEVKFGVIPNGSGNDFSATCGIPRSVPDALEVVVSDRCMSVDMGFVNGRGFINGLGIGMDGAAALSFPRFRFLGGFAGYLVAVSVEAAVFGGFSARVLSQKKTAEGRCLLAGVSNGASQGGGFRISPDARPDDGLLDFHFVEDMSFPMRILRLASIAADPPRGGKWIERFQSDSAVIETEKNLPAHMDGEPFILKAGKHLVETRKGALKVLSPAGSQFS